MIFNSDTDFYITICHINKFNKHTSNAMTEVGCTIIFARQDSLNHPVPSDLFAMPVGFSASYEGNTSVMLPPDLIFKSIQDTIENTADSFCVIMMHSQEFSRSLTNQVNKRFFDILDNLINRCIENNYQFLIFS